MDRYQKSEQASDQITLPTLDEILKICERKKLIKAKL